MIICNRWGEVIFMTNNIREDWDCKYNENPFQQVTFIYLIGLKDYRGKSINTKVL